MIEHMINDQEQQGWSWIPTNSCPCAYTHVHTSIYATTTHDEGP